MTNDNRVVNAKNIPRTFPASNRISSELLSAWVRDLQHENAMLREQIAGKEAAVAAEREACADLAYRRARICDDAWEKTQDPSERCAALEARHIARTIRAGGGTDALACPQCRDTGRVTDRGRFYGDSDIGKPCPDCATRLNHEQAIAERQARIDERHRIEDEIDRKRALYPDNQKRFVGDQG